MIHDLFFQSLAHFLFPSSRSFPKLFDLLLCWNNALQQVLGLLRKKRGIYNKIFDLESIILILSDIPLTPTHSSKLCPPPLVTYLYTNSCLGPPWLDNGCCRIEILSLSQNIRQVMSWTVPVWGRKLSFWGASKGEVLRNLNSFLQPLAKTLSQNPP